MSSSNLQRLLTTLAVCGLSTLLASPSLAAGRTPGTCTQSSTVLCLHGDRFAVDVVWEALDADSEDPPFAALVEDLSIDEAGYFYVTDPGLPELYVKVLDGTMVNGFWWVGIGALTDYEYTVTVTDTVTGRTAVYANPLGTFASVFDVAALPPEDERAFWKSDPELGAPKAVEAVRTPVLVPGAELTCVPGANELCLDIRRFKVEVEWMDAGGNTGLGFVSPLSDAAGYVGFFRDDAVDLMVRLVEGDNGSFWFSMGGTNNVEYSVRVTDVCTGTAKIYDNPSGTLASLGDLNAFPLTADCTSEIFVDGFESGDTIAWDP